MPVSLPFLQRCAAETGFGEAALEKVVHLGELASQISSHPLLGKVLALKGGTALNLSHGEPARLSVDLDFNYVGSRGRADMLKARPEVEETIERLARRLGYRTQRSVDAHAGRKVYLRYSSVLGSTDRVEIDLNYLFRVPAGELRHLALWQPGGLDRPRVLAVPLVELLAGKINALLDRVAVRDLWDVSRLSSTEPETLASPRFRAWFLALSAVLPLPLTKYGKERLETRVTTEQIGERLLPMLAMGQEAVAEDLIDRAWAVVAPLLDLKPKELEYVERLQEGDLRPGLLFPDDPTMTDRVANHPAVLWRLKNIRRHIGL
ncbi:nucleotidyl transferase AbiEii/AbiGii toxin family protein [bacterium]|nr:nucleotidyl transferase AbiEii/AbiGii toxin family protein [bacterium]